MIDIKKVRKEFEDALDDKTEKVEIDWILCEVTKKSRSEIRNLSSLTKAEYKKASRIVNRRKKGIPLDKIIGHTNFYGFDFVVTKDVLIPRFETEFFVEYVMNNAKGKGLDIGTGSGAIAIVLTLIGQNNMVAVDISKKALRIAKKNSKKLNAPVEYLYSNLFEKVNEKFDFIVSNPPYIKSEEINSLQTEVKNFEPRLALDGGNDGLFFYKKIIQEAPRFLKKNGKIFFEIGKGQEKNIVELLEHNFKNIKVIKDLSRIDRIISAEKK